MVADRRRLVGEVSLDVFERGAGVPLLFLHGEDGLVFSEPVLAELAADFRVTAPHHPGWGGSTRPAHVTDVRDLAAVYAELLDDFDEPPLVVGCSFGGWLAAELALLARDRIAGLVLVAPTGIKLGDREDRDFADIWISGFDEQPGILYGDPGRAPDLAALRDEEYLLLAVAQEATARFCWKPYMYDPKLRHWLRRIAVPSLVVAGDRDAFALLPDYYTGYAALIGADGAPLKIVAGGGHRLEEEEPAAVAALVRELASRTTAGASAPLAAVQGS